MSFSILYPLSKSGKPIWIDLNKKIYTSVGQISWKYLVIYIVNLAHAFDCLFKLISRKQSSNESSILSLWLQISHGYKLFGRLKHCYSHPVQTRLQFSEIVVRYDLSIIFGVSLIERCEFWIKSPASRNTVRRGSDHIDWKNTHAFLIHFYGILDDKVKIMKIVTICLKDHISFCTLLMNIFVSVFKRIFFANIIFFYMLMLIKIHWIRLTKQF